MTASLYDANGQRKYLTPTERVAFLRATTTQSARSEPFAIRSPLPGAGYRRLALTADRVDLTDGVIVFETLKKRQRGIYRPVPVPPALLDTLNMVHDLKAAQKRRDRGRSVYLWTFARNTAWRHVCAVIKDAKISGPHATPKGLRHGFGIKAVTSGVPLNALQIWLGHAQLSTTSIYADATGLEAKQLAERMWG